MQGVVPKAENASLWKQPWEKLISPCLFPQRMKRASAEGWGRDDTRWIRLHKKLSSFLFTKILTGVEKLTVNIVKPWKAFYMESVLYLQSTKLLRLSLLKGIMPAKNITLSAASMNANIVLFKNGSWGNEICAFKLKCKIQSQCSVDLGGHASLCQALWILSDPASVTLSSVPAVEPIHMTGMCRRSCAHKGFEASKELFYGALIVLEGVLRAWGFLQWALNGYRCLGPAGDHYGTRYPKNARAIISHTGELSGVFLILLTHMHEGNHFLCRETKGSRFVWLAWSR